MQTGDATRFPSNVGIVVGPNFAATHLPGYPSNPRSEMMEKDFVYVVFVLLLLSFQSLIPFPISSRGRPFWELDFSSSRTIGGLKAYDFWGDGSLYILDTPGVCAAIVCQAASVNLVMLAFNWPHQRISSHQRNGIRIHGRRHLPLSWCISTFDVYPLA